MNAEYPSFSFCLHPRGKDYAVSDSVYKASGSSEGLFETPIRKQMLQVLERHGDPNAVVLDIGANIGLHAMFLANAGYKVHVFEPLKKNYDLLACSATSSARLHNNVVVNPYGLGKEVGKSCIVTDHDNFGAAKIKNGQTCTPEYTVEVRRLDEYLTKSKIQPTLIKIDTEGYEFKALITAKEIFKKNPPPHIFTEFVPRHFKDPAVNEDPEDYLQFFYDLGYKIQWRDVKEVKKGDANYKDLLNTDMNDLYMYR
ncbi:hypothetical protein HDU79_009027 [Rhizoclosmatium sp. JEL0117]|nr:hypothetical protein HDU79_009027 [Rhizoclosmatium sp. JEL0117]